MKQVLIVSGSGMNTANTIKENIIRDLSSNKVKAIVTCADLKDYELKLKDTDILVSTFAIEEGKFNKPIISGMPFLTGVRKNSELAKLIDYIHD